MGWIVCSLQWDRDTRARRFKLLDAHNAIRAMLYSASKGDLEQLVTAANKYIDKYAGAAK